ncbi:MAG: SDR family oxidoreductase [Kiritimatiellae bacterium]|nr:SDR family oxidoreductase [Kiritimatiellia bacterium]MDD5522095.1 SDR family oxidoreductase [Kiritimatiellia bacterium]
MNCIERFRLDGKKALVTGGGQGLGKAFAEALAEAGADVAISDIRDETAKKVAEDIRTLGRQSLAIHADTSRIDDVTRMVGKVIETWGRLDIAVNNVGIAIPIKEAIQVTEAEWDKVMDTNLRGTFFCAQVEARAMLPKKQGKIINIASICGHIVWPEPQAIYSISKAGVCHLTRCLAAEWIKHGIRVNSISPGVTRTPDLFPEVIPVFLKTAPIDHVAEVKDLQSAVLYLASETSDFMVGHDLVLDGGYTIM